MLFLLVLSISVGASNIPLSKTFSVLFRKDEITKEFQIINYVRIPRTLAAIFAGCALSLSGLILQTVLDNALAGPSIIGVSSGSGLFTTLITALFPAYIMLMPVAAFAGAFLATLLVYLIAKKTGASRIAIVLSGVAVSSFIGAITDTILTIKPDTAISRTSFLIGGLSGVTMKGIKLPGILIFISFIAVFVLSYDMNILSLGDETAKSLGLNVPLYRFIFIVLSSLFSGSAISFAGLLGFIGLIVPHASRLIIGSDTRLLVIVSALLGSSFTLLCDIMARTLFAPYEIPVGIIMSFLGGPFFIYLLFNQRRRVVDD
ncbi:MAG: iron ABC transporter permease [Clostridiaceae bacterium]|nr:iron ABC transporter permease [Clostridiaceae bacterium]